eukprot:4748290-Amphidinium_carterae.1
MSCEANLNFPRSLATKASKSGQSRGADLTVWPTAEAMASPGNITPTCMSVPKWFKRTRDKSIVSIAQEARDDRRQRAYSYMREQMIIKVFTTIC